jgi:hypothetical protein
MSENGHHEPHQIGRLAEDYDRLKNDVRQLEDRVERVQRAYQVAAISFRDIVIHDDHLSIGGPGNEVDPLTAQHLQNLLSRRELIDLFHERSRLRCELDEVRNQLREWLNHV